MTARNPARIALAAAILLVLPGCLRIEHHIAYHHAGAELHATDRIRVTLAHEPAPEFSAASGIDGSLIQELCADMAAAGDDSVLPVFPTEAPTAVRYDPDSETCTVVHGPYPVAALYRSHVSTLDAHPKLTAALDTMRETSDAYILSVGARPGTDPALLADLAAEQQAALICAAGPYPPGYPEPADIDECLRTLPQFLLEDPAHRRLLDISIAIMASATRTVAYRLTISGEPVSDVSGMQPGSDGWSLSTSLHNLLIHDPADPPQPAAWTVSKIPAQ